MISSELQNLHITGMAAAVPTCYVATHEYDDIFGAAIVERNISTTGVKGSYHAGKNQTSSDLGYAAAKDLLEKLNIDPQSIGVLIFVATSLDYQEPPTACVLHHRLGLSMDCIAFDTNLACSGYIYGLQTLCASLATTSAKRGLLITGDITSKVVSPLDKSRMLFGDGGTATLVEKREGAPAMRFGMKTDGSRFKSIIVPASLHRMPDAPRERTLWGDGNIRSDYDLYMNGAEVFTFTMTDVPKLAKEFMEHYGVSTEEYDAFVFHQPNLFILKHLAKKINAPPDRMLISLDRYGNTSVCSIPLTICDAFGGKGQGKKKLFLYGFGVGLSWACVEVEMDTDVVFPIIQTDDYYQDGAVDHGV